MRRFLSLVSSSRCGDDEEVVFMVDVSLGLQDSNYAPQAAARF